MIFESYNTIMVKEFDEKRPYASNFLSSKFMKPSTQHQTQLQSGAAPSCAYPVQPTSICKTRDSLPDAASPCIQHSQ